MGISKISIDRQIPSWMSLFDRLLLYEKKIKKKKNFLYTWQIYLPESGVQDLPINMAQPII